MSPAVSWVVRTRCGRIRAVDRLAAEPIGLSGVPFYVGSFEKDGLGVGRAAFAAGRATKKTRFCNKHSFPTFCTSMSTSRNDPDCERINRWVHEYGQAVRGYIGVMVRDPHRADDVWQEVFGHAWKARQAYQENGHAKAYLFRIADHLVCDLARKKRMEVNLDDTSWQQCEPVAVTESPGTALQRAETRRRLMQAMDELTPAQRRVLLLRYFGQLGFQEIADIMHCPLGTVLSHCRRGLIALRGILVECLP